MDIWQVWNIWMLCKFWVSCIKSAATHFMRRISFSVWNFTNLTKTRINVSTYHKSLLLNWMLQTILLASVLWNQIQKYKIHISEYLSQYESGSKLILISWLDNNLNWYQLFNIIQHDPFEGKCTIMPNLMPSKLL